MEDYFERAANFQDPVKRITYMVIAFCGTVSIAKIRKKKAFNSMLGETYELVTDRFKYVAEKVQHYPNDILASNMEGKSYRLQTYHRSSPKFRFNGGKGMVEITQVGVFDFINKKYGDYISMTKFNV